MKYEKFGEIHVVRARKEVILAGGAIGSPHTLMLSGVGPKDHLQEHGVSETGLFSLFLSTLVVWRTSKTPVAYF